MDNNQLENEETKIANKSELEDYKFAAFYKKVEGISHIIFAPFFFLIPLTIFINAKDWVSRLRVSPFLILFGVWWLFGFKKIYQGRKIDKEIKNIEKEMLYVEGETKNTYTKIKMNESTENIYENIKSNNKKITYTKLEPNNPTNILYIIIILVAIVSAIYFFINR